MRNRFKFTSSKNQVTIKKMSQMDENMAKKCHLHAPISQKLFSKSKSHSHNATEQQRTSLAQKKIVNMASLLIFTNGSKRRLNKKYFE